MESPSERVAVIGAGRAGLATALTLVHLGHEVVCADIDTRCIEQLSNGRAPFKEPELQGRLAQELASGRLRFVASAGAEVGPVDLAVLCVPTPSRSDGTCDLSHLYASIDELERSLAAGCIVVTKSTVPVGTNATLAARLRPRGISVVANPEFLREGAIMQDSLRPSRIVLGGSDRASIERVRAMFSGLGAPVVETSYESAELTKYAANCYLAVRYSFVNELAALAAAVGADIHEVLGAMAFDSRIGGTALKPSPGWGGPCLPKDSRALLRQAEAAGHDLQVLRSAVTANERRVEGVIEQARHASGGSLEGIAIAVWGLGFKADTDDARESPAIEIAKALVRAGARCCAYDPAVAAGSYPSGVERGAAAIDVCRDAQMLVVLSDWEEFTLVDLREIARALAGTIIIDTSAVIDVAAAARAGLQCLQIGQRTASLLVS